MFSTHGDFGVVLHQNIFIADIRGAWNIETAQAYGDEATRVLQPVLGSQWAQVTIISDWELMTPDAVPYMVKLFTSANALGLQTEAVINSSAGQIKNELFSHSLQVASEDFARKFFRDFDTAIAWLTSQGFPARSFDGWHNIQMFPS